MVDKLDRHRYKKLKRLMKRIEAKATELKLDTESNRILSLDTANSIYQQCMEAVEVPETKAKNRKRRRGDLTWDTVADLLK
jgi:phage terminase large subunit-like protein